MQFPMPPPSVGRAVELVFEEGRQKSPGQANLAYLWNSVGKKGNRLSLEKHINVSELFLSSDNNPSFVSSLSFSLAGIFIRSLNPFSTHISPRTTRACYTVALLLS